MELVSKESFLKCLRQNSIIQIIQGENSCFTLVLKGIQCKPWPKWVFLAVSRGLSSSLSLLQPTEVKRRPCMKVFAWDMVVQWCAVPGSVILKHLLTGKGLWEQTWDWQVGFNSRDFVQLPKNHSPDAGAEHMLPDRNDVLGKRGSQQVSVRHWFWVQHCLALSFSWHCLCISNWLGLEVYFFIMLHPESTSPEANSLLTICFSLSLSLFLLCMRYLLWAPYSPHTFILKGTFLLLLLRDHSLPKTLIFLTFFFIPALLEVSSLSESTSKERASMHALKQKKSTAPDQSSFTLSQPPWSGGD